MRASTLTMALTLGLALAAAAMCVAAAEPQVSITFPQHGKYADAGEGEREVLRTEAALAAHLEQLARRSLQDGTQLSIEFLEIDLAGRIAPAVAAPAGLRVLNGGADWPRIELRYTVTSPNGEVAHGRDSLSDPAYLQRSLPGSGEPLRHEKRLLNDWFQQRFPEQRAAAR